MWARFQILSDGQKPDGPSQEKIPRDPGAPGLPWAWAGVASSGHCRQHLPGSGAREGLLQTPLHGRQAGSPSTRFTEHFRQRKHQSREQGRSWDQTR